jgi:hypothetical protein
MLTHFLKRLLIADVIIFVLLIILQLLAVIPTYIVFCWFCLIFFSMLSVIVFSLTARGALHNSTQRFLMSISLSFIVKFVLCTTAIVCYVLVMKHQTTLIIVPFFIFYVIFTSLEATELLFLLKTLKEKVQ